MKTQYRVHRWNFGDGFRYYVVQDPKAAICVCVNRRDADVIRKALNRSLKKAKKIKKPAQVFRISRPA